MTPLGLSGQRDQNQRDSSNAARSRGVARGPPAENPAGSQLRSAALHGRYMLHVHVAQACSRLTLDWCPEHRQRCRAQSVAHSESRAVRGAISVHSRGFRHRAMTLSLSLSLSEYSVALDHALESFLVHLLILIPPRPARSRSPTPRSPSLTPSTPGWRAPHARQLSPRRWQGCRPDRSARPDRNS